MLETGELVVALVWGWQMYGIFVRGRRKIYDTLTT